MANWYGAARSNYVKIKDMAGLRKALEPWPIEISEGDGENEGKVCFLSEEQDSGGWPSWAQDEDENEIEFDAATLICPFMEDGEILVTMESGAEKLRYVNGHAVAYNAKGECCAVSLTDIYSKASETFGVPRGSITAAEY